MELYYDNNKLKIPQATCSCTHHQEINSDIYIGSGILKNLSSYISKRITGKKCLLITDNNLFTLYGKQILPLLSKKYDVKLAIPSISGHLQPNQYALGDILMELDSDCDFLVAFGSGTINDLTRYVAFNCNLPFVSVGTAPSMDGYLSVVAPMLKDDLKINKPAKYPEICVFDIDIMRKAPDEMIFAGFGDVIGKYIAKADWILGNIINDERICPFCLDIIDKAISLCETNINEIKNKTEKGVKSLLEALLLTGLAMLLNGDSRPAASNEHNMGHFIEMKKLIAKQPHPSHGEAVGVTTLYCLDLYHKFLNYDFTSFSISETITNQQSSLQREQAILKAYGPEIGPSIIKNNVDEPITLTEQERRVSIFFKEYNTIKDKLSFLPTRNEISKYYKELNGATTAKELAIDKTLLKDALLYAKDYRSRYTVFKLVDELGILHKFVNHMVQYE